MLHLWRAVARPRKAEVIATARAAVGFERLRIKRLHMLHMKLQTLRRLTGVADSPCAFVDFPQHVFGFRLFPFFLAVGPHDFAVLDELFVEAEFLGECVHDRVICLRLEQRADDALTPLNRAVRGRRGTAGFKLGAGWQQIHAILAIRHRRRRSGIRVNDDHGIDLFHCLFHLWPACLRVRCMAPENDGAQVRILINRLVRIEHAVDPAGHCHARFLHHGLRRELLFQPFIVHAPNRRPVLPSTRRQAVVARQ